MVSAKEKSGNSTNLLRIKKGLKKKAFEFSTLVDVDARMIIYDLKQNGQDVALQKGGFLFNFEMEEDLKNEFTGFDEQNVKIDQMIITEEEEENLLDSSCTGAAASSSSSSSSSEVLVEGDNCIWPSDELNEILNAFCDNADDDYQENMFDLLPLSPPPLPLTNVFIDNILDSTSDNWPTYTMVEWDQLFI